MSGTEPLVIFTPSGRRGRVPADTTVLDAARALGVDMRDPKVQAVLFGQRAR